LPEPRNKTSCFDLKRTRRGEEGDKMNDYTYDKYIERWNSRYGESQSAEVNYSSHGVILPMTINKLSPGTFEYVKNKLRKLQEKFDFSSGMNDLEGMEKALSEMIPYELVLLTT
jgi:hypothetical protein